MASSNIYKSKGKFICFIWDDTSEAKVLTIGTPKIVGQVYSKLQLSQLLSNPIYVFHFIYRSVGKVVKTYIGSVNVSKSFIKYC